VFSSAVTLTLDVDIKVGYVKVEEVLMFNFMDC
jgi:hypothetical protein